MFAVSLQNNSSKSVSQMTVLWDIYFRWCMWHERCHHWIGIFIRHQYQQYTDSDEQRRRQYEWQALVSRQHSTRLPPPHRLSTSTNPHKPKRPILLLTPMDKHIWQPGSTGVHCDSPNQPLDIHCSNFPLSHSERRKESKREGVGWWWRNLST